MGNFQSRQRYYDVAYEALQEARALQHEIGGPPIRGAILAYIDGRIDARRCIHDCAPLEANEFARLAAPVYVRWMMEHQQEFRCQPVHGRCQYPNEMLHFENCQYDVPLPPGIEFEPTMEMMGAPRHGSRGGHGPPPAFGHSSHGGHPAYRGHATPLATPRGHGNGFGYDDDTYDSYAEEDDEDDYSDGEDLYARSMSQASSRGFVPGRARGGMARGGAPRGGAARGGTAHGGTARGGSAGHGGSGGRGRPQARRGRGGGARGGASSAPNDDPSAWFETGPEAPQ